MQILEQYGRTLGSLDRPILKARIRLLLDEIFVQVLYNNEIMPRYMISNFGRVWDCSRYCFLKQSPDKDGYARVSIKPDGNTKFKTVKTHRLMLMSFKPFDDAVNYNKYEVNHIDGNKSNNNINNLEWSTGLENTRHAWKNGLTNHYGENHPLSIYTDDKIHEFCKMIDSGMTNSQIADSLGITEKKNRARLMTTLSGIRLGKTHLPISSQYSFMNNVKKFQPSDWYIHLVCRILSDGNEYTLKEVCDMLNVPPEERLQFVNFVSALITGDTGLEISRMYGELKRPLNTRTKYDYLY